MTTYPFTLLVDHVQQLEAELWRGLVKWRADYRCEECVGTEDLHAHHLDGDHSNNTLDNGQCLCRSCHARVTHVGKNVSEMTREKLRKAWEHRDKEAAVAQMTRGRVGKKRVFSEEHKANIRLSWERRKAAQ